MNYIKTFDPCILLGDRLEITLYGMFVEAYRSNRLGLERDLYEKFIDHFPGEVGVHTPDVFSALIDRISEAGFDPCLPVYSNPSEFALMEGSHRCAIAIQLGFKAIPYSLRLRDDRVDERVFHEVLGSDAFKLLQKKRDEYISRCDPLTALKCRLRIHMRQNENSFTAPFSSPTRVPCLRSYQAYEKLGISGKRPAERRVRIYELARHLDKKMNVLEVGCNVGFLSLAVAELVGSVKAFDLDPNFVKVAEMVSNFCKVDNCRFFIGSINDFVENDSPRYDCVISTAIHGWTGLSFGKYVTKISHWLRPGGVILFESHELETERDWPAKRAFLTNNFDLIGAGLIDDVDTEMYESEMREFLVLRKRKHADYSCLELQGPVGESQIPNLGKAWRIEFWAASGEVRRSASRFVVTLVRLLQTFVPKFLRRAIKTLIRRVCG